MQRADPKEKKNEKEAMGQKVPNFRMRDLGLVCDIVLPGFRM